MRKQNLNYILSVSARILFAFVFVFGQTAWAAQNPVPVEKPGSLGKSKAPQAQVNKPAVPVADAQTEAEEETPLQNPAANGPSHRGGQHEGIKVHGHWTIEVRNPDGTVVTHREFENSLVAPGATLLAGVLGRQNTVGGWTLTLFSQAGPQPCVTSGSATDCLIVEPGSGTSGGTNLFSTLSVSVGASGSLVLSGTAVAGQNGTIDRVLSQDNVCAPTIAPAACVSHENNAYYLTSATLTSPVNVSFGQTVAVTVTLTFA